MFRRSLYRRAVWLAPVIRLISRAYFEPDDDFIRCVVRIREARNLNAEVIDFQQNRRNCGFLRRRLKIRISCHRVLHLVDAVMGRREAGRPTESPGP